MAPSAVVDSDQRGAHVGEIREQLERDGRDPQAFTCGFWRFVLLYRDDDQRDRLLANPITKWMTAAFGRLHHGVWKSEGIDLDVDEVVSRVTPR